MGRKHFVRDGDFDDCSCRPIMVVIKRGAVHYEYSVVFNRRKVLTKELIYVTVLLLLLYVVSHILFKNCFPSKCILYRNKSTVFSWQINGLVSIWYEFLWTECLNRIFIFDYSCQAFSTLKPNERHNNLFLFVLSSGNLLI